MPSFQVKESIYSVGSVDWNVRVFHGYQTPYGATYNAYLVLDDQITLIDSVKAPFTEELIRHIEEIVPLEKIDNLIVNHIEPDHSGALPELVRRLPSAKVYGTAAAKKGLDAHYGDMGMDYVAVKAGDTLKTGKYTFHFLPMPMVHWPDSMSTYLEEEQILFSNDALGQHIASDERFDDQLGLDRLLERAGDYYANIVLPFGVQVQKLLEQVTALPLKLVCPSHGVMLRTYIGEMAAKYSAWARNESDEMKAVVIYDTMWGATRKMAETIAERWQSEGKAVELIDLSQRHVSYAMARLLEAKYIAVGSSTLNRNVMPNTAAFLTYMKGLSPKNRVGLAFGAYGWSGESIPQIDHVFEEMGWQRLPMEKAQWKPQ